MKNPFSDESTSINPIDFEKEVKSLLKKFDPSISQLDIIHNEKIEGIDGNYQIDILVKYLFLGMDFKILVECKRYNSAIKRETVQILNDKVRNLGVQKGLLVSASGFQKGAIEYAKLHGIALVRILNGEMFFETRSIDKKTKLPDWIKFPKFAFSWIYYNSGGSIGISSLESQQLKTFEKYIFNEEEN
jgi:restriction system protein